VCLILPHNGPFKGEVPVFARLWPIRVRIRVSFTTGAVRSATLATAGFLVQIRANIQTNTLGWKCAVIYRTVFYIALIKPRIFGLFGTELLFVQ